MNQFDPENQPMAGQPRSARYPNGMGADESAAPVNQAPGYAPGGSAYGTQPPQEYAGYAPQQSGWQQPQRPAAGWQQPYPGQQSAWTQPNYRAPQQGSWNMPYSGQQDSWVYHPSNGYEPPRAPGGQSPVYQQKTPQKGGNDGGMPPRKGLNMKLLAAAAVALAVLVIIFIVGSSAAKQKKIHQEVTAYDHLFCEGVYVDGIHLGGMTQQQAYDVVASNAQSRRDAWYIRLTYQGGLVRAITPDDVGMTVDVNEALEAAWNMGHASGSVSERKAAMDALQSAPYHGYTALPSGSTSAIDAILAEIAQLVYLPPQNAAIVEFNPQLTYPFVIQDEVPGRWLDTEAIKEDLYQMVTRMESGSLEITPSVIAPDVTAEALRATVKLRGSAITLISTRSTEERTKNIKRAMAIINGTVLRPGESFSFNGVVGERSAANGFFKAIEYAYGEEREGYGGGVCQASTTVYLAAVKANLAITKREPHSDAVNYTTFGMDATVNLDGKKIDLVFKNNTDGNVYIVAKVEFDPKVDKQKWYVKVEIYGPDLGAGVTYDLVTEEVELIAPPEFPEYVKDKTGTYVVYIDDEPVQKRAAVEGHVVDSFRVMYVNGEEVSREYLYTDTYKAKSQQFWVGVKERE